MIRQMYSTTLCKRTGVRMILVQYNTKREKFLLYTLTIIQWATINNRKLIIFHFLFYFDHSYSRSFRIWFAINV